MINADGRDTQGIGRISFETIRPNLPPWTPPPWHGKGTVKKIVQMKGDTVVQVEITSIDLDQQYIEVNGKRAHQTRSPRARVGIRLTGEMVQADGKADLTEDERTQLAALLSTIENRLAQELSS